MERPVPYILRAPPFPMIRPQHVEEEHCAHRAVDSAMAKRMPTKRKPAQPATPEAPLPANDHFKATQREAYKVKLLAQELGITPGQVRSLMLAYGRDMAKIRAAAERLRRS